MSVSSGSDITIPIQDSPPPPPSPYAGDAHKSKTKHGEKSGVSNVSIVNSSGDGGRKTPEPRGYVTVTVGFVNEGYQDQSPIEEKPIKKNGKNGAIQISVSGGDNFKKESSNGKDHTEVHLNEAVNPELINMNILNTIPEKANPEFGPYDNMDESEKLYVTKDKRKENRWKKYVCWLIGASILAAIVTVAVLAGIGLIPQKSPSYTDSVVGTTPDSPSSAPTDISSGPDGSLPSSTEINTPPSVPSDATYVPLAADINFHIKDLDYEASLNDKNSERFQSLATEVQDEIKAILKIRAGLENVNSRVSEFAPGSVFVKMRIGWADPSTDYQKVKQMLSNVDTVEQYKIMALSTYEVVNHCKFNNNGCSQNCSYDYTSMDFYCSCDESMYSLGEDKKTCQPLFGGVSSTSTTEELLLPELSSSVSYLPEEILNSSSESPSSSTSESVPIALPEEEPTSPTEEQASPEPEPETAPEPEPETISTSEHAQEDEHEDSTDAPVHTETEPVSQHHHEETIALSSSSTTEQPLETVSVEGEHDHGHDEIVPFSPETTTTSTTETPILDDEIKSDEPVETTQPAYPESEESVTNAPVEETNKSTSDERFFQPMPTEQGQVEEEMTRTEARSELEETPQVTESPEEVGQPEQPELAENITAKVQPKEESDLLVPTEVPAEEESEQTTVVPQTVEQESPSDSSEQSASAVSHNDKDVIPLAPEEDSETTTVANSVVGEDEQDVTTVVPDVQAQKKEEEEQHHITPMDVLSFSSDHPSTTAATHVDPVVTTASSTSTTEAPLEAAVVPNNSIEEGRSLSESSETEVVEPTGATSPPRSQSLIDGQEETATENASSGESGSTESIIPVNRAPRLFSAEGGNTMEQLIPDEDTVTKSKNEDREEVSVLSHPQSQNVTESASVETADENPETASVTSVSSEHLSGSREAVTHVDQTSRDNNISGGSSSGSGEFSQESPASASGESSDAEESTTLRPLSLRHDIDISYLGNVTEDQSNTEHVAEVESITGGSDIGSDKEKLVLGEDDIPQTTTAPEQPSQDETAAESVPAPVGPSPVPISGENGSGESREETTRSITTSELVENDDSGEYSNRDHRDVDKDVETHSSSSSSASVESASMEDDEALVITTTTPEAPLAIVTTTTTTTTTTSTPPPAPVTEAVTTTSTSTTTTSTATEESHPLDSSSSSNSTSIISNNHNHPLSEESSSISLESSSNNSQSQETSHELLDQVATSASGSASNEGASNSASSGDLLDNELT